MDDVLDYLYSPDRKRRIALFRRRGGSIGYREEYWYQNGFCAAWLLSWSFSANSFQQLLQFPGSPDGFHRLTADVRGLIRLSA